MQTEVKNKKYIVTHDTGVVDEYNREQIEKLRLFAEQQADDADAVQRHYTALLKEMNESSRDVD